MIPDIGRRRYAVPALESALEAANIAVAQFFGHIRGQDLFVQAVHRQFAVDLVLQAPKAGALGAQAAPEGGA